MPVTGVITAAGRSSRMAPDHKLIMDLNGKTLIQRSLESLLPFCSSIIIVTGTQDLTGLVKPYTNIRLIQNPHPNEGMFSSIKIGLSQAPEGSVLFLPGDCPFTPSEVIRRMLKESGDVIAAAYKGKTGHPLLLSEKAIRDILNDETLLNLKQFLEKNPVKVVNSSTEVVLWDIDTHSDLHKARIYFEKTERERPHGKDQSID